MSEPGRRGHTKAWAAKRIGQVLLADAAQRACGDSALLLGDVPRSPADISANWLTGALGDCGPGARVRSVRMTAGSVGTTTRGSLELTYAENAASVGLPTRVFAKCTPALAQRLMLGLGGLLHGEPGFYTEVRPRLEIEAPLGYFGRVEPRSWRSIVLIEDVTATRGARFWAISTRTTRDQIEDLLATTARWHGALWDSARLGRWRWLKTPAEQMRVIDELIGIANRIPAGFERAGSVIPPRLLQRRGDLFEGMRRSMALASQGRRTYLHGDLHIANTYLTRSGRMGVVDWQVGLQGSWAFDYGYLVATALAIEDRRDWEDELLEFYLDRLAAAGGERIGWEAARRAYRAALFYPYFAWLYTTGRSKLQPNFQPREVCLAMVERIAVAMDDLDSMRAVGL